MLSWVLMLVMALLFPCTMIGFGRYFLKSPPKDINALFGYRSSMSSKNEDTWLFAHSYCGRLWYVCGLILAPVSLAVMLFVLGKDETVLGRVGGALCAINTVLLVGAIIPTERALRKTFDKNGNRR